MNTVYQKILFLLGIIAVVLGAVGAVIPVLPTFPFLLLAAACFDRSSPRFHRALMDHAHFGPLIRDFYSGKGIPRRAKGISLITIWLGFSLSCLILTGLHIKIALALILAAVSFYLLSLKTSDREAAPVQQLRRSAEEAETEEERQ